MNNVAAFPPTATMTVKQALASAASCQDEVSDILIVGYYSDGSLFVRSSRMDRKDALWLSEQLRLYALNTE